MASKEEIMTFYGRCRCCLEYGYMKSMWKEHRWDDEMEIYGEMLMETFNITWDSNSSEEHICENCVLRLRDAFHFKKEVLSSEQLLEEGFEDDMDSMEEMDEDNEIKFNEKFEDEDVKADEEEEEELYLTEIKAEYGEIEFLEEDAEIVEQSVNIYTDSPKKKGKRRPERCSYRNYTQADMKKCVEAIQKDGLSQSEAARKFNIPTKTVNAKMCSLRRSDDDNESPERDTMEIKKHRDNIQAILKYTNATPIRGYRGIGYICYFCPKQFPNPKDLKQHTRTHEDISEKIQVRVLFSYSLKLDITGLNCNICKADIDHLSLESSMGHLKRHGKILHTDVKNHIIPFKFGAETLNCCVCDEVFSYFKLLSAHMSEHYSNYSCKVCNKGFINKHARKTHTYKHLVGIFPCSICDKTFSTKQRMKEHVRAVHILQNKRQLCGFCNEKFVDVVQKTNHEVEMHGLKRPTYTCKVCDKVFESQRSLTDHVKRCHLMLRPHKCEYCDKSFFKKSALSQHLVTHTGERNYECDLCRKSFGTRSTLRTHIKVHSDLFWE